MQSRSLTSTAISLPFFVLIASHAAAIDIDWVLIDAPRNPCDVQPQGCFGAVSFEYEISRTEVTNAQYAEFLNAVAKTDPTGLYDPLNHHRPLGGGGIDRSGAPGSYQYDVIESVRDRPVAYVHRSAAEHFAAWLSEARPVEGTVVSLPTEDQWYKAAYFDPVSGSYFDFPTSSNEELLCAPPSPEPNAGNCNSPAISSFPQFTAVGSYTSSPSPFGTFDQGGNAREYTGDNGPARGGSRFKAAEEAGAAHRPRPLSESFLDLGFRVARVPDALPYAVQLLATSETIDIGEPVEISWSASPPPTACTLSQDLETESVTSSGSMSFDLGPGSTLFEFRCEWPNGHEEVDYVGVQVELDTPHFVVMRPSASSIIEGDPLKLEWVVEPDSATGCELEGSTGLQAFPDAQGSHVVYPTAGSQRYEILCSWPIGAEATDTVDVEVAAALPYRVRLFGTSHEQRAGDPFTLSWSVDPEAALCRLTSRFGLGDYPGTNGSSDFDLGVGTTRFEMRCEWANGDTHSAEWVVVAYVDASSQQLELLADPPFIENPGDAVTLTWRGHTDFARSMCKLHDPNIIGAIATFPFFSHEPITVHPERATVYTIECGFGPEASTLVGKAPVRGTAIFTPFKDVTIRSGSSQAENYGASPELRVGIEPDGRESRVLLQFPIRLGALPRDATITRAELVLQPASVGDQPLALWENFRGFGEGNGDFQKPRDAVLGEASWLGPRHNQECWDGNEPAPSCAPEGARQAFDYSITPLARSDGTTFSFSSPSLNELASIWQEHFPGNTGLLLSVDELASSPGTALHVFSSRETTEPAFLGVGYEVCEDIEVSFNATECSEAVTLSLEHPCPIRVRSLGVPIPRGPVPSCESMSFPFASVAWYELVAASDRDVQVHFIPNKPLAIWEADRPCSQIPDRSELTCLQRFSSFHAKAGRRYLIGSFGVPFASTHELEIRVLPEPGTATPWLALTTLWLGAEGRRRARRRRAKPRSCS